MTETPEPYADQPRARVRPAREIRAEIEATLEAIKKWEGAPYMLSYLHGSLATLMWMLYGVGHHTAHRMAVEAVQRVVKADK